MSEKRTNPLVYVIIGGIFILALAAILVFGLGGSESRSGGSSSESEAAPSKKKKEPPRDLTAGQTMTRAEVAEQGIPLAEPAAPVDTNRISMTFKQGKTYKIKVKAVVETRGSYKDWGITTDMNTKNLAEYEFLRRIEINDGNRVVVVQEFPKLQNITLYTEVESISVNLGTAAHTILDFAGALVDIPPGSSRIATNQLNNILSWEPIKNEFSKAIHDENAKLFTDVDTLQGKKCRLVFENGRGVTSVEPIGCTLTPDEYSFIMDTALLADIHLLPDEEYKVGEIWHIRGEDFLPIVDPSMHASLTGTLTAQRDKDKGEPQNPIGIIRLKSGMLELLDRDEQMAVAARWAPRGELEYSFSDKIITSGRLGGDLSIVTNSLDHVVFEMRNVVTPKYEATYHCEILK